MSDAERESIEAQLSRQSDERVEIMDTICMTCPATRTCNATCTVWVYLEALKVANEALEAKVA